MAAGTPARAETVSEDQGQVELAVAGSADERVAIQRSLSELLSRLNVGLAEQGKAANGKTALASARVELDEVECRITLTTGPDARVVMFRRVARKGSAAVMAETVALIIHGAVEELLQSPRRPVVSTAPPEPKLESIGIPSMPWPTWTLDVSAFGGSRVFGGNAPLVAAAGLGLTAGRRFDSLLPEVWLTAAYNTPFDASSQVVALHAQTLSLRGGLALRLLEHDDWYLEGGLGAGADVFFTDARFFPSRHGETEAAAAPVATGLLTAHYALGSRVDLFVAFTLDLDLQPRRFVANDGEGTIYEPMRVRPALVLGFDLAALGAKGGQP
ncbi:MAG: hypothetical protein QM723_15810 [Myxococcaceae bacterium]